MDYDTGITSEVFTIKSETRLTDIFNEIIEKKSSATFEYIESLDLDEESEIIVVGTYFTGIGIVKKLSGHYSNITLIDIYPHLKELIDTEIGGTVKGEVKFSTDLDLIYSGDVVIDTTGFGGLTVEQSGNIKAQAFIIEDPVGEDNDRLLSNKNNIHERMNAVKSDHKAIIKTKGIDAKTSGTMTLAIKTLTNALNSSLSREGVLYSACEMGFFEEIIFKEKDISKFLKRADCEAMKISTIDPFSCDELLENELDKIKSEIILK